MNTLDMAKSVEDYVIKTRRFLHQHPEVSNQEKNTSKLIGEELTKMNIKFDRVDNSNCIIAYLGNDNGKCIALRADMDALPMKEESDVEFISQNGEAAHTCGHDAHTAMLLGAAKLLKENEDKLNGKVKLFFQEGEENLTGAKKIIEAGGLDGVDYIFALHVMDFMNTGEASADAGYRMAGGDGIYIKFVGTAGHGSAPHLAKDSISAACSFVTSLNAIIAKMKDPQEVAVAGVGTIHAGTVGNIIPKECELGVNVRYYNPEVQDMIHEQAKIMAESTANIFGVSAEVKSMRLITSLKNDVEFSKLAADSFAKFGKVENTKPLMSSEDFAEYLKHVPGTMGWLGFRNEDIDAIYPIHHEKFKLDEACFKYGVAWHLQVVFDYLNK
ncbi:MAG: amidohydrolase [Bacilli bacterium]|jgi:amidohydrolase|nr:amidohydrolase [Bacilli bacterium]